jgi:asparagine synthase (glutamine-hydrolysing)
VCGIAGYTHSTRPLDQTLIRRIIRMIRHRGPDQDGTYLSDQVSMGAVRLKIIDLEGGQQPMQSEDGQTILVYNGEIYNYKEIRQILIGRGHRFSSNSDTEVVLHAFLEWDTGCFEKLKGMFAIALWQVPEGRMVLARDRMGIKPLYFTIRGGEIYFGSELKVLLAHSQISRTIDLTALDQYLSLNYVPGPRTLVEGIEKLPPGHYLEWSGRESRILPYWNLEFRPVMALKEADALEELDRLMRHSIREHLISDVPLGILLSGGVDSSTIVHYAAAESSRRLKTFSISFQGRRFDESQYARKVAEQYGTEHYEFNLSRDLDLENTIRQFAEYADEPCGDSSSLPVWYVSQLSRQHVTVALSGEGADELFGGYLTYQADRLASYMRLAPQFLRRAALDLMKRHWPVSDEKIGLEYMAKRFLEGTFLPASDAHCYWNGAFSEEQKSRLCAYERKSPWTAETLIEGVNSSGGLNPFLQFDQKYYLPDDILAKVDRMSMAHSLEVRPPFLDHQIVEFATRLPQKFKIRGTRQKYLLKQLMRNKLPKQILTRAKMGFDIPAHDWFRRELKPLLLEVTRPSALSQTGIFRPEVLGNWLQAHSEGRVNMGFHLWGILILLLWMEKWQIQSPFQPMEPFARSMAAQETSPIL